MARGRSLWVAQAHDQGVPQQMIVADAFIDALSTWELNNPDEQTCTGTASIISRVFPYTLFPSMKHLFARSFLPLLALLPLTTARAQAPVGRYEDLTAWSNRDVADAVQFNAEIEHAKDAAQLAEALRATATRQRQTTDQLIALVRLHPELRHLPTLGLDPKGMQQWLQSHPHAQADLQQIPTSVLKISQKMTQSISSIRKNQVAIDENFRRFGHDPQVKAATKLLIGTLQDNRLRLLKTFS